MRFKDETFIRGVDKELDAIDDVLHRFQARAKREGRVVASNDIVDMPFRCARCRRKAIDRVAFGAVVHADHLWGDVPGLMPPTSRAHKVPGFRFDGSGRSFQSASVEGVKNGNDWFGSSVDCSEQRKHSSKSPARKAASAMIAKIPEPLARHIARVYRPNEGDPHGREFTTEPSS